MLELSLEASFTTFCLRGTYCYGTSSASCSLFVQGGHSGVNNTGGGCLDSLGSGILVGKRYFGVLQKYKFEQWLGVAKMIHMDN